MPEISEMMATESKKLLHEAVKEIRSEILSQIREEMADNKGLLIMTKEGRD